MPKPYSYDLRQKVIQAIKLDGLKISEASVLFGISHDTIRLWLKREPETGDFQALPNKPPGNGHKINDWGKFTKFVEVKVDKTQVEMAQLGPEEISDRNYIKSFKENRVHSKKKTYGYQERNEIKRAEFREEIVVYKPEKIVYIDEAGMDNRENYSYGWNERGQRFYDLKSGRRQGRINMITGFCNRQLLAPFTVESSCNQTVFKTWLEACLIPTLKPGPILIVDNATFHKCGNIIQLIEAAGCQLKYLSSYSPDLNKFEQYWSWLKSRIRKQLTQYGCLRDAMEAVLRATA